MAKTTEKVRAVIAGGGTGGHLFPGIAVAKELEKRFVNPEILFVVGQQRMESEILSRYGYETASIRIEGLKGRGLKKGLGVISRLPKSFFQSASIIKKFSPAFVLGVGAYSSGPVCLTASLMKVPTAIHEQNSFPGLTNRLLSRFVDLVFVSFEQSSAYLKGTSKIVTGNPVREDFFMDSAPADRDTKKFTVLVSGGSQGALAINKAFVDALDYLEKRDRHLEVIHQTGKIDYSRVEDDYHRRGLKGEIAPFIQDMKKAYERADLVVCRAGASTLFELAAMGKPSVLIPYPYATNQHQKINAQSLVQMGGAEMILQENLSGDALARCLIKYMENRSLCEEMGMKAKGMAKRDAAKTIVDHLVKLAESKGAIRI